MAGDDAGRTDGTVPAPLDAMAPEDVSAADPVPPDAIRGVVLLALGATGLALEAVRALIEISTHPGGDDAATGSGRAAALSPSTETLQRMAMASVGLAVEAQRRCLNAAEAIGGPVATTVSAVLEAASARGPIAFLGRRPRRWSEQGLAEQRRNREITLESGRAAIRAVIAAVLTEVDLDAVIARVDLNAAVAGLDLNAAIGRVDLDAAIAGLDLDAAIGRVDLNAAIAGLDLNAVIGRVDLNAAIAGVDLDAVVARVDIDRIVGSLDIDAIAARIDLDAIAARIDLDAVAARLDLNAVLDRIDLARVTEQVLDEVDVGHIVRESSGAMAAETVDAVRIQGMRADRFLSRIVDRVLLRPDGRDTGPVPTPGVPADRP